jgi:thiol-disulfide isomerase/thioredoxin
MKKLLFITSLFLLKVLIPVLAQQTQIEIPLQSVDGYGIFEPALYGKMPEPTDFPYKQPLKGLPKHLKDLRTYQLILDEKQFFYQQYMSKKMTQEQFDQMKQGLKFEPNKKDFSLTPIRASVYLVTGKDEKENRVWMADTDADLDFSNEKLRPLLNYETHKLNEIANHATKVSTQTVKQGKVINLSIPVTIATDSVGEVVYYNYPRHYTGMVNLAGSPYQVRLYSDNLTRPRVGQDDSKIIIAAQFSEGQKVENKWLVGKDQYLLLNNISYQYLGVDSIKRVVKLKQTATLQTPQIGFTAPAFQALDFSSQQPIATEQLKGKYVLLDFWATWCEPCIKEFPRIKSIVSRFGEDKLVVVGIIGDSKADAVKKLIDERGLTWKQILSDQIISEYNIEVYPTTFLIAPDGKIIDKDLRGEKLEEKLSELIK